MRGYHSYGGGEPEGVTLFLLVIALTTMGLAYLSLIVALVITFMDHKDALELKFFGSALGFIALSAVVALLWGVGYLVGWW